MRRPATSDTAVMEAMLSLQQKGKKNLISAVIAEALGLTVFQITARLKSMERRGMVNQSREGWWSLVTSFSPSQQSKIPTVSDTSRKAGWSYKTVWDTGQSGSGEAYICMYDKSKNRTIYLRFTSVYIDPQGRRWRDAAASEPAMLIRTFNNGLSPARLTRVRIGEVTYVNPDDAPKKKREK